MGDADDIRALEHGGLNGFVVVLCQHFQVM